jgi:hypothetical protein
MRCITSILLIIALCITVVTIRRHRLALRIANAQPMPMADESTDVASTLRAISASEADAPTKGWATRFVDYVNDHPGRQWVVGHCEKPALSESEAADTARTDAARKLYPLVARRLNATGSDADLVQNLITQDVRDARLESDRFAEQFTRPYGQVWAESVLLDVSPTRLDPLIDHYRQQIGFRHLQTRRHAAAGGFIIVATALLYLLLNSVTKGYFTTRLRFAATVIAAAVLILIL